MYAKYIIFFIILYLIIQFQQNEVIENFPDNKMDRLYDYLPLKFYYIDNNYRNELIKLNIKVLKLLDKYKIQYWAIFGTLLGIIRHNGIIPWDDDIDIAFSNNDLHKLLKIRPELEKNNLKLIKRTDYGRLTYKIEYKHIPKTLNKKIWIDLFPYYYTHDTKYWHRVKGAYTKLKHNDLFPLKKCKYFNYEISIPNNPKQILNEEYGADWTTHAVVSIHQRVLNKHKIGRKFNRKIKIDNIKKHMLNNYSII